ncbi:hypothetical protein FRB94_014619 [Tulasnella sp. JGI-2019a]|nr:hypothetical protein FRB94_014619 [Tulasnella sp. JGI-2019a]KAG9036735.1 hypothetical protein FRB95_008066 [Tulasnella sp. JGI-2019a]
MLPNLVTLKWDSYDSHSIAQLLPFLSPTVISLEINCHGPMGATCAKLLRSVTSRSPCLNEFMLSVAGPGEDYMPSLSVFLGTQRGLLRASLPTASATSEVVRTLSSLPLLREYTGWGDVEYQNPVHLGMEFDWDPESFNTLEELGFHATSLTDASKIMAKRSGPVLKRLFLSCLSSFESTELRRLSATLSTSHPNLTLIRLSLYSHSDDPCPSNPISFESIRPLLQCTALSFLMLWHHETLAYTEDDVAAMGLAWPNMESLELCLDPINDIGHRSGQPMRIVGAFVRAFPKLEELGVYINEAGAIPDLLEPSTGLVPSRFRVLDFGTSPGARSGATDPVDNIAMYLASICPPGITIYNSRTVSHIRNLQVTDEQEDEYARRSVYWEDIAHKVKLIHMGMKYMASGMRGHTH